MKEKELGNAAYKKKDFATALTHYDKAIEIDPTDITFLNNKAGLYNIYFLLYLQNLNYLVTFI